MFTALLYIFTGVNLLLYLYIIFAVAKKWKVSKANRRFLFLVIFGFLWILNVLIENHPPHNIQIYKFITYSNYFLAVLVAGAFTSFSIHFPNNNRRLTVVKEIILQIPIILLAFLSFSELFVEVINIRQIKTLLLPYYIYFGILIIYFIFITGDNFIKKYKHSTGITKMQLGYILIGYFIAITALLIQSLITNIKGILDTRIDLGATNSSILFSALTAYAMLRYRFMDIRVVIRRSLIYGISLLLTLALYTYLALTIKDSIEKSWNMSSSWTAVILIALVALGFPPLKTLVEKAVDTLFKGKKSIDLAVKELREQASQKKDLEALVELVSDSIVKYLEVEWVKFFIISHRDHNYIFEGDGETARIEPGNELVRYFEKYPEAVVRDEIPHLIEEKEGKFEKEMLQKVEKEMKKRNASLALPFKTEDELYSFAFLGNRREGGVYSVQDVEYLVQLREQVNFTLASAVLYRDAMERIKVMQGAGG